MLWYIAGDRYQAGYRLATGWGTEDLKPFYFMGVTEAFLFYVFSHARPTQDNTKCFILFLT